jgi:hypothetical protein
LELLACKAELANFLDVFKFLKESGTTGNENVSECGAMLNTDSLSLDVAALAYRSGSFLVIKNTAKLSYKRI